MAHTLSIIGLSGTNGSGKDTVGQLLQDKHGYFFISVTDLLRAELRRRNLPIERSNLRELSAEWRREKGLGVLVDQALEAYAEQQERYAGVVISSLRNPYEADRIHELGGSVIWVDADSRIRYDRISKAQRAGRENEDGKSYEQFLAEEEAEMHASGDAATLDMASVKARADLTILNESANLSQLEQTLGQTLSQAS